MSGPWEKYQNTDTTGPWQKYGAPPPAPPSADSAQPEGFLHSLGSNLGLTGLSDQPKPEHPFRDAAIDAATFDTLPMLKGLYEGGKRTIGELGEAGKNAIQGNGTAALGHTLSAIPVIGPGMDKASEQSVDDMLGALGTLTGTALQSALALEGASGAMGREGVGRIPSRGRAVATLKDIESSLGNSPVNFTKTQPALDDFKYSVDTGGKNAPVMSKLAKRGATGQPINFPEARDFYTNISRATAKPGFLRRALESPQAPAFRMNAGNVREALNSDLTDAAGTIGRGEDYTGAIKEYRQNAQLRDLLKKSAKVAIPAAAGAVGLSPLHRFLTPLGQ